MHARGRKYDRSAAGTALSRLPHIHALMQHSRRTGGSLASMPGYAAAAESLSTVGTEKSTFRRSRAPQQPPDALRLHCQRGNATALRTYIPASSAHIESVRAACRTVATGRGVCSRR